MKHVSIYVPGELGIRHEDTLAVTESRPPDIGMLKPA
jgi:Xaa-Pro aminopeptidase